jgi:hypothetical protein
MRSKGDEGKEIPAEVLKAAEDSFLRNDDVVPKTVDLKGYADSEKWEALLERGGKDDLLQIVKFISLSINEQQREPDGWGELVTSRAEIWKADIQKRAKAKLAEKYHMDIDRNDALKNLMHAWKSSQQGKVYETESWVDRIKRILVASERLKLRDIGLSDEMLENLVEKARQNAEE